MTSSGVTFPLLRASAVAVSLAHDDGLGSAGT